MHLKQVLNAVIVCELTASLGYGSYVLSPQQGQPVQKQKTPEPAVQAAEKKTETHQALKSEPKVYKIKKRTITDKEKKIWKNWVIAKKDVKVVKGKKNNKKIGTLKKGAGALILDKSKAGYLVKSGHTVGLIKAKNEKSLVTGEKAFQYMMKNQKVQAKTLSKKTFFYKEREKEKDDAITVKSKVEVDVKDANDIKVITPDLTEDSAKDWVGVQLNGGTMYVDGDSVSTGFHVKSMSVKKENKDNAEIISLNDEGKSKKSKAKGSTKRPVLFSIDLEGKCKADTYTYMGWQCITAVGSDQYKLKSEFMNFDDNGFGKINGRYVIATTSTFGDIGDLVDFKLANGKTIHGIIGDHKNMSDDGCNMWGHQNGDNVVEFVVDKSSWYGTKKTVTKYHPEWDHTHAVKAKNYGNIWDADNVDFKAKADRAMMHIQTLMQQEAENTYSSNISRRSTGTSGTSGSSSSGSTSGSTSSGKSSQSSKKKTADKKKGTSDSKKDKKESTESTKKNKTEQKKTEKKEKSTETKKSSTGNSSQTKQHNQTQQNSSSNNSSENSGGSNSSSSSSNSSSNTGTSSSPASHESSHESKPSETKSESGLHFSNGQMVISD